MSRCFGFPPPGYELKAGTGILDFITKKKYREKKHKKERRKHKKKLDKDGSKDKSKEKKDQNHKDRKKEKDNTKRRKSKEIKGESEVQVHNSLHTKEHWQKTDEANDSKSKEESNNRTRNDKAENHMFEKFTNSIQIKLQGVAGASEIENKKYGERSLASDSVVAPKPEMRKLGVKFSASSSFNSARRRKDVFSISVENVSIKAKTGMFQVPQSVEKDIHKKIERKNEIHGKEAEDRRLQHKTIHSMNKNVTEHNKPNNFGKKDQVKTLKNKPLGDAIGIVYSDNESTKKRKFLTANGFLRENGRPGKILRMNSSSFQSAVNGALNKPKQDRLLEKNERNINGTEIFHVPSSFNKNSDVSLSLLPHPDSKYLSQIYKVPKMAKLPEIDDQEWLFKGHDSLQKSKTEIRTEKIAMVFAEAIWIGSGNVLALPYVVPF